MNEFFVSLTSVEDVRRFVDAASRRLCEIDVLSGRYVVDGKSIMGLFSLDLAHPAKVKVYGTQEEADAFRTDVAALVTEP